MLKRLTRLFVAISLSFMGSLSVAQDAQEGALEVQTVVQKVIETVEPDGQVKTELVSVETALPGDKVIYTVTFRNVGDQEADNIQITNPIPAAMRYVDGTAFGPGASVIYSADGGATYAVAEQLRKTEVDGSERPAKADEYTHIRWALNTPLGAGERSFARFHAVVR